MKLKCDPVQISINKYKKSEFKMSPNGNSSESEKTEKYL